MRYVAAAMVVIALGAPFAAGGQDAPARMSLHAAALQGNLDAVRGYIEAGSDLNEKDAFGSTPLIIATTFGRTDVARALIEAGADLNLAGSEGATPLHSAAFLGRTEIVRLLLDHGANKYLRDGFANMPAESVSDPFEEVQGTYDRIGKALGPLGLELDYAQIKEARPRIARMLAVRADELAGVDYAPMSGRDWLVSTPEQEGLDPDLVGELYLDATGLPALYGLLVIRNGRLIGERYYHDGAIDRRTMLQSVTKSYTSALVGVALREGCLTSVDQRMVDFFPELADRIIDPRKREITLRQLLQMRAGYPWEESDPAYWDALLSGHLVSQLVDFPLIADPGTEFHYSNVTSHLLGVIVARGCGTDLKSFADAHLFGPLGVEPGPWLRDLDGYYVGLAELRFTARDMARFGQLYLDNGVYNGQQVVPADWVRASHQSASEDISSGGVVSGDVGRYLHDVGYGYQWWSARAGVHRLDYAWGHGGQFIILLKDLDMIVVLTSKPFYQQHDAESWRHELANLNLVGRFISSLPAR